MGGADAATNLHTLTFSITVVKRLLERRDADGELVQADPALIKAAIETMRAEVRRAHEDLVRPPDGLVGPIPGKTQVIGAVLNALSGHIDDLDRALIGLGN